MVVAPAAVRQRRSAHGVSVAAQWGRKRKSNQRDATRAAAVGETARADDENEPSWGDGGRGNGTGGNGRNGGNGETDGDERRGEKAVVAPNASGKGRLRGTGNGGDVGRDGGSNGGKKRGQPKS